MDTLRDRLYEAYASTHAGAASAVAADLIYRRDIRPHLPRPQPAQPPRVLDIGCGQGELVRLLTADGFDAWGVDASPEQVELARAAGQTRVELGDLHNVLRGAASTIDAVVATDVLEHQPSEEVMATFAEVRAALRPGGVFIARVPNAVSPTGGHTRFGDFTHESWFTARSVAQLAAVAEFASVTALACPPPAHGPVSAARALVWKPISGLLKLALAAETGQLRGHIVTQNLTFIARATAAAPRSR